MNYSQLKLDTYFLARTTSAGYPSASLNRNINIAYNDVSRLIWESAGGWQYDDTNASTLAIAKATLVHNQQDYSLPSTAQRLRVVNVKDSSGNFQKLRQLDVHDISVATSEFYETAGMPLYYDPQGRSLLLYPKPHSAYVTLSAGLMIQVDRDVTEFAVTASTEEPGFAKPFHRLLSQAAAIDFLTDEKERDALLAQKARLEQALTRFYGKRNEERRSSIRPYAKKRWRLYR